MIHIPILRHGEPYESIDSILLLDHATGEPVAKVGQANPGLIARDVGRMADDVLESIPAAELIALSHKAAYLFRQGSLPCGQARQSFEDYTRQLSATTGMPISYCTRNADKIFKVLNEVEEVLAGLTRGMDLSILDCGHGDHLGHTLSFFREGRIFGAVLPSNSPGVHALWIPAFVLKTPIVLKPGREEPWTPLRVIQAFIAAGAPRAAFGFYPSDHAGAGELLRMVDRAMLFGSGETVRPYEDDPRIELHGPGYSKVILDDTESKRWKDYLEVMASSITMNGGRSCINASGVWTPSDGVAIARGLAEAVAGIEALPANDPKAQIAAFANAATAEAIDAMIEAGLREPGAVDVTREVRGSPRLVKKGRCAWLLPTIIHCDSPEHPLANREFLFPFASVVDCPTDRMPEALGPTLIASVITRNPAFVSRYMHAENIDRLNLGPIPTWRIAWDQPHEGNLFELLYRQRAFQSEGVAVST